MKEIEIIDGESNIFGFIAPLEGEKSFHYMSAFFSAEQIDGIKAWLKQQHIHEFAVLRNIYVDESDRGKGLGKSLVTRFISQTHNLPMILLASPDEESFQLQEWYEKLGFELSPFHCEDGPLMIKR